MVWVREGCGLLCAFQSLEAQERRRIGVIARRQIVWSFRRDREPLNRLESVVRLHEVPEEE
jgi:hypothetical protein